MSPRAGFVLLDQIEPRLRATMPYIRGVGSEDTEELLQDALTVAAKMLHDLEERGKEVTPGNIAYYTILHMKSGRRSYSAGRTAVMNAGTQLDSNAMVLSFEEPAVYDPETDEEIPLGDMLAGSDALSAGALKPGRPSRISRENSGDLSAAIAAALIKALFRSSAKGSPSVVIVRVSQRGVKSSLVR